MLGAGVFDLVSSRDRGVEGGAGQDSGVWGVPGGPGAQGPGVGRSGGLGGWGAGRLGSCGAQARVWGWGGHCVSELLGVGQGVRAPRTGCGAAGYLCLGARRLGPERLGRASWLRDWECGEPGRWRQLCRFVRPDAPGKRARLGARDRVSFGAGREGPVVGSDTEVPRRVRSSVLCAEVRTGADRGQDSRCVGSRPGSVCRV